MLVRLEFDFYVYTYGTNGGVHTALVALQVAGADRLFRVGHGQVFVDQPEITPQQREVDTLHHLVEIAERFIREMPGDVDLAQLDIARIVRELRLRKDRTRSRLDRLSDGIGLAIRCYT